MLCEVGRDQRQGGKVRSVAPHAAYQQAISGNRCIGADVRDISDCVHADPERNFEGRNGTFGVFHPTTHKFLWVTSLKCVNFCVKSFRLFWRRSKQAAVLAGDLSINLRTLVTLDPSGAWTAAADISSAAAWARPWSPGQA